MKNVGDYIQLNVAAEDGEIPWYGWALYEFSAIRGMFYKYFMRKVTFLCYSCLRFLLKYPLSIKSLFPHKHKVALCSV